MSTFSESAPTMYFGVVVKADDAKMRVQVELPELDGLITAWLAVGVRKTKRDKDYWLPDIGEHVVCLLDSACENGVVICAIYSEEDAVPVASRDKYHKKFADGTSIDYDRATHQLNINCVGSVKIVATESIHLQSPNITLDAANVKCTGNLKVDGDLDVRGNIDAAGKITDAGGNSNHHKH
jgi:phage baseplate assembly protein V